MLIQTALAGHEGLQRLRLGYSIDLAARTATSIVVPKPAGASSLLDRFRTLKIGRLVGGTLSARPELHDLLTTNKLELARRRKLVGTQGGKNMLILLRGHWMPAERLV